MSAGDVPAIQLDRLLRDGYCPEGTLSGVAAKRLYRTAGAFALGKVVCKRRPSRVAPNVGRGGGITHEQTKDVRRPPLFLLRPTFPELRRTGRADFALRMTQG